jgi:hypothetical protein
VERQRIRRWGVMGPVKNRRRRSILRGHWASWRSALNSAVVGRKLITCSSGGSEPPSARGQSGPSHDVCQPATGENGCISLGNRAGLQPRIASPVQVRPWLVAWVRITPGSLARTPGPRAVPVDPCPRGPKFGGAGRSWPAQRACLHCRLGPRTAEQGQSPVRMTGRGFS